MFLSLHKVYNDCFVNGKFNRDRVIENKVIDLEYESDFRIGMLESIFNLVLNSKIMNELAFEYMTNGHRTYEGCVEKWNKDHPDNVIKISSGKNRIIYSARRINEIFDDIEIDGKKYDIIQWLCDTKMFMGIKDSDDKKGYKETFIKQFKVFNENCGEKIEIDKRDILLSIPTIEKNDSLSEEEFDNLMEVMRPYSRFVLNKVQEVLNSMEKEVGYLRFLMSKKSKLSNIDKDRRNQILLWLGKDVINDYSLDSEENEEEIDNTVIDDDSINNKNKEESVEIDTTEEYDNITDENSDKEKKEEKNIIEEKNITEEKSEEEKKEEIKDILIKMYNCDKSIYALGDYEITVNDAVEVYKIMRDKDMDMDTAINYYFSDLEIRLDTDDEDDDNDDVDF